MVLLLILCTFFTGVQSAVNVAFAAEAKEYSNVLDDLKKDSTFNTKNYPTVSKDY